MLRLIIGLFLLLGYYTGLSQSTYNSETIVPIIFKNCTHCHKKNGISQITFENTTEIKQNQSLIKYVVRTKIMPPWRADTSFHCFINDRRLTNEELNAIINWTVDGDNTKNMIYNKNNYQYSDIDQLKKPDMIISIPKPHKIPGNNQDLFVTYVLNTYLKKDQFISAIVIKPGNKKMVHHARIEIDTSDFFSKKMNKNGFFYTLDEEENAAEFSNKPIAIYLPGLYYNKFPKGTAYPIHKSDKILLHLHYAPTPIEEEDKTEIELYFSREKNIREVIYKTGIMSDYSVTLPPDSFKTIYFKSAPTSIDLSIFALQLHMHLLGKSIDLKALTPAGDTINMLNIPAWDFKWQEYYYYKKMVFIPKGSIFITTSVFDNTKENPMNPNIPPKIVNFYGMDTKNEMMGYICLGVEYKKGDEEIIILPRNYENY